MHSVAHNMINMTDIVHELLLEECGLEYQPMDPFSTMLTPDGQAIRFYRDLSRTCDEIARLDPAEAKRYRAFIKRFDPLVRASTSAFRRDGRKELLRSIPGLARWLRSDGMWGSMAELLSPYGSLLDACCETDWMKGALAALAAHATVGPDTPGGAFYVMWQAAYHRYGMWHPRGGSGALAQALRRRLEYWGGRVAVATPVTGLEVRRDRIAGVKTEAQSIPASIVITTINPKIVLTEWLPPQAVSATLRRKVHALSTPNAVQFVVHISTNRLPAYVGTDGMSDAWNGMAAMTRSLEQVSRAFRQAELGLIPDDPPVYIFTPSAIDPDLGRHTVYLACPCFPGKLASGAWAEHGMPAAERLVKQVEDFAPGFKASITGIRPYTPDEMEQDIGLRHGHPMHLALAQSQLLLMRPTPELASGRTPIRGLYLSGAGTAPAGGVVGIPGRRAAEAVLRDYP